MGEQAVVNASIKYGVLCPETALIAYQKIAKLGEKPEFVKIPLNIPVQKMDVSPEDSIEIIKLKIED